jgi:hypothetical protein
MEQIVEKINIMKLFINLMKFILLIVFNYFVES